jgi:hypothetical protein
VLSERRDSSPIIWIAQSALSTRDRSGLPQSPSYGERHAFTNSTRLDGREPLMLVRQLRGKG